MKHLKKILPIYIETNPKLLQKSRFEIGFKFFGKRKLLFELADGYNYSFLK